MLAFKEPRLARVQYTDDNTEPTIVLALGVFVISKSNKSPSVSVLCETEDGELGWVLSDFITFEKPLMAELEKDE